VILAGAMATFFQPGQWEAYLGGGIVSILLMMAAGVPVYVCATASVPIAAGLMHVGASPGAALAFLIAGPATNAATFTTIWKLLNRRTAMLYLATVALSAIGCGLLLDGLFSAVSAGMPQLGSHAHHAAQSDWWSHAWAIGLLAVLAFSYWAARRGETEEEHGDVEKATHVDGQRIELLVTGMTCSHCAESVRRVLSECDGVRSAEVSLGSGRAVVGGEDLDVRQLVAAVAEMGYKAKLPEEGAS